MISESFANIVNPNSIEHFQNPTVGQTLSASNNVNSNVSDENSEGIVVADYYNFIGNINNRCVPLLSEMNVSNTQIGESCVKDGNRYIKSNNSYLEMRKKNLKMYSDAYKNIKVNHVNEFDKHSKIACIMNKMLNNIMSVSEEKQKLTSENLDMESIVRENEKVIEENQNIKSKDKNNELVNIERVEGTKNNKKNIKTQYIIFITLIIMFLIIQLVIFFV